MQLKEHHTSIAHHSVGYLCDARPTEVNPCLQQSRRNMLSDKFNRWSRPWQCQCLVSKMFLLCNTQTKTAHERKREKTTSLEAHSFWQRVRGKLPRYYFSLSWHEAEAGKRRWRWRWWWGCCGARASAGPLGTPLPGGGKSMWFLSYLWEGWSTASNTDIQWVAKRNERVSAREENTLTRLPQLTSFIHHVCACETGRVWICRWTRTHTHTCPQSTSSTWTKHEGTGLDKSIHQSLKMWRIKETLFHSGH